MSAAFRPSGFWLETVHGYRISDRAIDMIKREIGPKGPRYIAQLRDATRYELTTASYEAAFGSDESRAESEGAT